MRLRPNGAGPILFVCDHASNAIPEVHANLGLSAEQRADHIAWDPGAAGVTEALSDLLDCPAILARASRLLIDCNRHPSDIDAIPKISETTSIPGNVDLSPNEVDARIEAYHTPFHAAIEQTRAELGPQIRAVVSLHSYVPVFHGQQRPWHLGLVYNADRSQGSMRLLFAINPTTHDEQIPVGAVTPAAWRQLADHEHFFNAGRTAAGEPVEPELFLPAFGCGLWVCEE